MKSNGIKAANNKTKHKDWTWNSCNAVKVCMYVRVCVCVYLHIHTEVNNVHVGSSITRAMKRRNNYVYIKLFSLI
jgi:hypothetical protein